MFTFGRAISATDYEAVASQAPGVTRAAAYWTFDEAEQRTLVTVYVGDDAGGRRGGERGAGGGRGPEPAGLGGRREPDRARPVLHAARGRRPGPRRVVAAATAAFSDPAGGLFSPARMGIGQRLYRSAVDAALMVPGVVAVHELDGHLVGSRGPRARSPTPARARSSTFRRPTSRSWG